MKQRKRRMLFAVLFCCLGMTGCTKDPEDSQRMQEILEQQECIKVVMGEAYHQETVLFYPQKDKAVIPENAKWGRPSFREGENVGIYYGEDEGGELYESAQEISPELYLDSYMHAMESLDVHVSDIKEENYVVKVVKPSQLKLFEEELSTLSSMILKDEYDLTGVEITFDKQCRPVQKVFQLRNISGEEVKNSHTDAQECVQEYFYDTGKSKFERIFRAVKEEIEEE